jgi:hypothetical protein
MSKPAAYLLLGRSGDLCTLLPALKRQADLAKSPVELVVSRDYASILSGVSYVTPVVFPNAFDRPNEALAWSRRAVINCTVYGVNFWRPSECWAFDREVWNYSRCDIPFGYLPLVFDRRSLERERLLAERVLPKTQKPIVLTSLKGTSSPFQRPTEFLEGLKQRLPDFEVVDISGITAEKPYDLLGLYQRAAALVAIDSMPLHLSWATPQLNTIALITDGPTPWHRTSWRPHHNLRLLYSEAHDSIDRVVAQIQSPAKRPTINLVYSQSPNADVQTSRRLVVAAKSRKAEMDSFPFWKSVDVTKLSRSAISLGDVPLPFVRDMVEKAFLCCETDDDIIAITNADIGFTPGITGLILEAVSRHGAAFAHRWDFSRVSRPATSEAEVKRARWYVGSDFFVFTRKWWRKHGGSFPDMVLGREAWDMVLRNLIKKTCGLEAELHGVIWHERHPSPWEQQKDSAGNRHNRALAREWIDKHGGDWNDWNCKPIYK